jgi:hypothetical protein
MSHLDLLIPFSLPPAELAGDLFKQANAPAFATLLSRGKSVRSSREGFRRVLPHEEWLARAFGMASESSPAIAPSWMQAMGLGEDAGMWYAVQPVHIHIARDHLVLTDPSQLEMDEQDSLALFEIAASLFQETGRKLVYGNAGTWFVRADDWPALLTASPDAASGHNIDIWMPSGPGERNWRKVQNEVQMHWFDHPINARREQRGLKLVNSLWLWGGGMAPPPAMASPYALAFNLNGWMTAMGRASGAHSPAAGTSPMIAAAGDLPDFPPGPVLVLLDHLLRPSLDNDWGRWLEALAALESAWFEPILNKMKQGTLSRLRLILTNNSETAEFALTRHSLRKFWIKPSLAPLHP